MRGRPRLSVYLDPAEPAAGDRLRARVSLTSQGQTPYDAIDVTLVADEARYSHTSRTGKRSTRRYHRGQPVRLGARFEGGQLEPGELTREVTFTLPPDAPPTFRSEHSEIVYTLSVRVHIPWWPDRDESYTVQVRPAAVPPPPPRARMYSSQHGEHRGDEPVVELSLDHDHLEPGGELRGAVALTGLGDRRLRRVEVSTSAVETPLVSSAAGPTEVSRRTWTIHEGTPPDGASLPFRLTLPDDLTPTFASTMVRVDSALEVVAVVAFGRDLSLRVPVVVERPDRPAAEARAPLPLVGRERQTAVFREVLAAAGELPIVEHAAAEARLVMVVGDVRVGVSEEHREEFGVCLVADLDWPRLDAGLRVAERRWSDLGGRLPGLDAALQERLVVQAREAAHAARLLEPRVAEALLSFDEVALDDGGAVVVHKGGVYRASGLRSFLDRVHQLARRLDAAVADLPRAAPAGRQGPYR